MDNVIELEDGVRLWEILKLEHQGLEYSLVINLNEKPNLLFIETNRKENLISYVDDEELMKALIEKTKPYLVEGIEKIQQYMLENKNAISKDKQDDNKNK